MILPSYGDIFDGQKLLLLQAWVLAGENNAAGASSLLVEDIQFWRMQLVASDTFVSRMIATSALQRHFAWGNLMLRKLPAVTSMSVIPAQWLDSISDEERSMERVFRGEWMFVRNSTRHMFQVDALEILSGSGVYSETSLAERLRYFLARSVFQAQDTSNKLAELVTKVTDMLDVPYTEYANALESLQKHEEETYESIWPMNRTFDFYNITGDETIASVSALYSSLSPRAADLEGFRKAALATIKMRSLETPENQATQFLNASEYKNPYDGKPFVWDSASGSVVFTGLAPKEKAHEKFQY